MVDGTDAAPGAVCGVAGTSRMCPGVVVLLLALLPPVGWVVVGRNACLSARTRRILVFLSAAWFGLWPLPAWQWLRNPVWAIPILLVLVLFVVVSGLVWVMRRALRRPRWSMAARAVLGVGTGVMVTLLAGGCGLLRAEYRRAEVKRALQSPAVHGPAHLDIVEGLPILHLYGTPEEMGTQYGTILRPALRAMEGYYSALAPSGLIARAVEEARPREARMPDRLRRELKAVAQASGVSYERLLALNLTPRPNCQVLLAWGKATPTGEVLFARNSEYMAFGLADRGSLITVWHPDEGPAQLSINLVGMIGSFNGATETGLCFGNLMVHNARERTIDERGLPMQLVLRDGGHRFKTAEELKDELLDQPPIIPMMVALADTKDAYVLELSTSSRAVRPPREDYVAATFVFEENERAGEPGRAWTRTRYPKLLRWAEAHVGRMDAETLKDALQATRSPSTFNIHAMIFEPARMKMHVSFNRLPAADGPFVELDLEALFATPPAGEPRAGKQGQTP